MAETKQVEQSHDIKSQWEKYFGPSPYPLSMVPYHNYDRYDLPTAYVGKNLFLAQLIDTFILQSDITDFSQVILPLVQTDDLNIQFNVWSFGETLANRVPFEGTSRLLRSKRSQHSDKLVRRGLAFMLEHGFFTTPLGRESYARNIEEIVKSVQLTLSFDVLYTLATAKQAHIAWRKERGLFNDEHSIKELMDEQAYNFGLIQKDPNGFDVVIEQYKKHLGRFAIVPDSLILPSKLQIYIPMVPEQRIVYSNRGPLGIQQFEAGALTSYRNLRVYESRDYDLFDDEMPVNLLSSHEQIGQYNVMSFDYQEFLHSNSDDSTKFKTWMRDIYIFDAESDNFQRIRYLDALKAAVDADAGGSTIRRDPVEIQNAGQSLHDEIFNNAQDKNDWREATELLAPEQQKDIDALNEDVVKSYLVGVRAGTLGNGTIKSKAVSFLNSKKSGLGDKFDVLLGKVLAKLPSLAKNFVSKEMKNNNNTDYLFYFMFGDRRITADGQKSKAANIEMLFESGDGGAVTRAETAAEFSPDDANKMNKSALKSSKSVNADLYENVLEKVGGYDSALGKHVVAAVSQLIKKHIKDLNDPTFVNSYKLLERIGTKDSKNDMKILERMGYVKENGSGNGAQKSMGSWITMYALGDRGDDSSLFSQGKEIGCELRYEGSSSGGGSNGNSVFSSSTKPIGTEFGLSLEEGVSLLSDDEVEHIKSEVSPHLLPLAKIFLTIMAKHRKDIINLAEQNIYVPVDVVLYRPFITFEMYHAILCKSGPELGNTFVAHSDFQLGSDARSKLILGHYTFLAKAVVRDTRRVILMKNVFINSYQGGMNTLFFDKNNGLYEDKSNLDFSNKSRPSIIPVLRAAAASRPLQKCLDIRNDLSEEHVAHYAEPNLANEFFTPNESAGPNPFCYAGPQMNYDIDSKRFTKHQKGSGHLGESLYPGCMAVLSGSMKYFDKK